jgi:hypothetical protein
MSTDQDKNLDDFFKKGLEDPVDYSGYEERDWNALEQMLDKNKKRKGIVYWLPALSAVAALLLLFLGWWAFQSNNIQHSHNKSGAQALVKSGADNKQSNTGTNGGPIRQTTDNKPNAQTLAKSDVGHKQSNIGISGEPIRQTADNKQTIPPSANFAKTHNNGKVSTIGKSFFTVHGGGSRNSITGADKRVTPDVRSSETLAALNSVPSFSPESITASAINLFEIKNPSLSQTATHPASKNSTLTKQHEAFRPRYALTVLAAPDLNGVGSFQQSKLGTNVGLLFSAGLVKKLTVSTGVLYSAKPYTIAFENYQTQYHFPVNPVNVTANCQMLDIPVNVGYQLYNKRNNEISIGTGLSSYIMLHENYKFNYADPYVTGPSSYSVPNSSSYLLGVLNLNATYKRQLNSKVGISVQPYLKLPLTNLGYSQVRLQTTGVAVGLNWNLNSPKP